MADICLPVFLCSNKQSINTHTHTHARTHAYIHTDTSTHTRTHTDTNTLISTIPIGENVVHCFSLKMNTSSLFIAHNNKYSKLSWSIMSFSKQVIV